MKNDRMQKAEYLFREIGNIHDRWVSEALLYQPKRSATPRILLIAASIALCASLTVATLVVGMMQLSPIGEKPVPDVGGDSEQLTPDRLLLSCRTDESANYTVLASPAELNYFSSSAHVVWQYADSSAVYVSRALTEEECDQLEKAMENSTNATSNEQPACKIWILYGDGRVISPYLHPSIGNTGESELFDYNVEIIPDADFTSCLSEILY